MPPAPVVAEPAPTPSTVKFTVAPTTPALVSLRVSVAINVTGPVDPNATLLGLTLFITSVVGTVALTVKELDAVLPVKVRPPPLAVIVPVVLFLVPEVVAVTLTDRVHEPFAGIVPPVRLTVVAPAPAENVPPQVLDAEGVLLTCKPAGNGSLNAAFVSADPLLFVGVKLSVDAPPTLMLEGEKALLMAGGAKTPTVYVMLSLHWLPPPEVHVGDVMLELRVIVSPVSGAAGAVK